MIEIIYMDKIKIAQQDCSFFLESYLVEVHHKIYGGYWEKRITRLSHGALTPSKQIWGGGFSVLKKSCLRLKFCFLTGKERSQDGGLLLTHFENGIG